MTDPKRLLHKPALSSAEERVLEAAIHAEPPQGFRSALWTSLASALPAGALEPAAGGTQPDPGLEPMGSSAAGSAAGGSVGAAGAAAGVAGVGALAKATGLGVALGLLALTGHTVILRHFDRAPATTVASVTASVVLSAPTGMPQSGGHQPAFGADLLDEVVPPLAAISSMRPTERPPELPVEETASPAPWTSADPVASPGMLPSSGTDLASQERRRQAQEESRLVASARTQLRSGDATGALHSLREADSRFPAGILGQEREALAIEALAASGQRELAARRARVFLNSNPSSPHASRVRAFLPPTSSGGQ